MINTSIEFQQAYVKNSACITKATILLKNGTLLNIDNAKISQGATKIDDGVSSSGGFDIGSAITNKLTLSLNNRYDDFSDYDFTDAVVTAWVGKQLSGQMEWMKKGVYNTNDPTATPAILTLECLDNMSKFDTAYDGNLSFPATLQSIVQYCCSKCGVLLVNGEFPNYAYTIQKNPFDEKSNVTYRAIISYCALLAGCYARCNVDGRLELKWYDTGAFDDIIDGGIFDETTEASYQTGDSLDGGNFTNYSSGDTADGGTFTEALPYHHIYSFSSLSVSTEDVVITGIRVTAADSEDNAGKKIEGETYLCGAEGYVLDVSGNPLVENGKAKTVAEYLAGRVVGMRFRPFQANVIGDPSWEAGDAAIITDRKGNSYHTYLTNITYSTGGYASISCDAEPAARHSTDRYSEINKIVADIKKDSKQQLSEYAQYVDQLNTLAVNAMGYYETTEAQADGSMIKYMHDKPVLSESTIVYKNSIDGFFWSKDGGQTYTAGVDKDGNAVMNVIAAIGISFDWAHGGTLTLGGQSNQNGVMEVLDEFGEETCRFDKDGTRLTGEVTIKNEAKHNTPGTLYGQFGEVSYTTDSSMYTTVDGFQVSHDKYPQTKISLVPMIGLRKYISENATSEEVFLSGLCVADSLGIFTKKLYMEMESRNDVSRFLLDAMGTDKDLAFFMYNDSVIFMGGTNNPISKGIIMKLTVGESAYEHELYIQGNLLVSGDKARVVDTHYGTVVFNALESPDSLFEDFGGGEIGEDGKGIIYLDPIFADAVNINFGYRVLLTSTNSHRISYVEKHREYFIVYGEPSATFDWNICAKQKGFENNRYKQIKLPEKNVDMNDDIFSHSAELEAGANIYLENYEKEIIEL
nr:MAG TPA: hypothetical protein [Bacteriophage sp.]